MCDPLRQQLNLEGALDGAGKQTASPTLRVSDSLAQELEPLVFLTSPQEAGAVICVDPTWKTTGL